MRSKVVPLVPRVHQRQTLPKSFRDTAISSPRNHTGLIGFSAKDLGGVVVIGPVEGSLQNEFAYDTAGQRRLSRQQFSIQRTVYVVEYSNVIMDRGRLVGYDAKILTGR
jgi:hypothetical protein